MNKFKKRLDQIIQDPGRGGCGIIGIADINGTESRELFLRAINGLINLEHRGGTLDNTGDGAGLIIKPSRKFFEKFIAAGRAIPSKKEPLMVGCVFFPRGEQNIRELQREFDLILRREGLYPLGWRKVPINKNALEEKNREDIPRIYQVLLCKGHRREKKLFHVLYSAKNTIEAQLGGLINVVSLNPYTTIYKALATSNQLRDFYIDFNDSDFKSSIVVAHRRFSTNTFSNWNLIQPFRYIVHNGEINTITANCRAIKDAQTIVNLGNPLMNHGSDSAQYDRVAEIISVNGMNGIHEAIRRMSPPAWSDDSCCENEKLFFSANRRAMGTIGSWEGPTAMIATDGKKMTAILDRMGLRPLRYMMTNNGWVIVSSEVGATEVNQSEISFDGQLEPGKMITADIEQHKFIAPEESNQWIINQSQLNFKSLSSVGLHNLEESKPKKPLSIKALNGFGWTKERIENLRRTIKDSKEPIHSMGNDKPLAIFSENNSRLFSFLHQIVAVVTNPPIDPIREGSAIDLTAYLGRSPFISKKSEYKSWAQYELPHPILTNEKMDALISNAHSDLKTRTLDATFEDTGKPRDMIRRINELTDSAIETIKSRRASILVVSDISATKNKRLPLPTLFVISSIHRALARNGLRRDASIVVQTAEVHEGHDMAILIAYGATAVNPYAMFNIAKNLDNIDKDIAVKNLTQAILKTLKAIMAKMGITSVSGYRGSALFEAVGLSSDVVEYFIPDTVSRLGGLSSDDIYKSIVSRFSNDEETIANNRNVSVYDRNVVTALQKTARNRNSNRDYENFTKLLENKPPVYLRDILDFKYPKVSLPINNVSSEKEIIKSCVRGAAMSYGALNSISHRAIAGAFNYFDSYSNCGEGGEDRNRNIGQPLEHDKSKTRQIASGRFGVDVSYLINADEIEIKIGQGAKPGEGGHLPARKVNKDIAKIRKTKDNIDLISPPPHHDIYSIEDLAQIITNLRELNPKSIISVKVPSITNLGTISVGIVKAGADIISISGFSGGTGAASAGSISHAGLPIERGVSETHQYLTVNGIRNRVIIRAEGGIKSGNDITKIIALGADEIAIGTPLLIAERCIFCRGCNKGNCPAGIADHKVPALLNNDNIPPADSFESRYEDAKQGVINYLRCLAGDVRNTLSKLGLKTTKELVGRTDLLFQRQSKNPLYNTLDLSELLLNFDGNENINRSNVANKTFKISEKNKIILESAQKTFNNTSRTQEINIEVNNYDHALGSTLAGELSKHNLNNEKTNIMINTKGYAGHGFGFAATSGMKFTLEGYANDTIASAMEGSAKIIVKHPHNSFEYIPHLVGNSAAYGATGGTLYIAGKAGQRFGIRNSGAILVCEGVGKYAFEYMTGGIGIVLGSCSPCIGSGMTGGKVFIYDPTKTSKKYIHRESVNHHDLNENDYNELKGILNDYINSTSSSRRL